MLKRKYQKMMKKKIGYYEEIDSLEKSIIINRSWNRHWIELFHYFIHLSLGFFLIVRNKWAADWRGKSECTAESELIHECVKKSSRRNDWSGAHKQRFTNDECATYMRRNTPIWYLMFQWNFPLISSIKYWTKYRCFEDRFFFSFTGIG